MWFLYRNLGDPGFWGIDCWCGIVGLIWSPVLGRGCDEAEISEERRLFTEWGPDIQ